MSVKPTSKISKYRAHNSIVNRMTNVGANTAVTPVDRVSPISNSTALISYNSLIASDEFYDKLTRLQKEYRRFYHDQQELEEALDDMSEDRECEECLVSNMRVLVEKYNIAMASLRGFDLQFRTDNRANIVNLLNQFKTNLKEIGVTVKKGALLEFDEEKFKESILHSEDALKFLFRPIKGLIINLHRTFKNIKVPDEAFDEYGDYEESMYNGLLTDETI